MKKLDFTDFTITTREQAKAAGEIHYYTGKVCKSGHSGHRYTKSGVCIGCARAAASKRWATGAVESRLQKVKNPVGTMLNRVKSGAKMRGIEFALTKADISIPEHCPCCSARMQVDTSRLGTGKPGFPSYSSPSLDRLDSSIGYLPGNVAVICWRCNMVKGDATLVELERIAGWIRSQPAAAKISHLKLVSQGEKA